MSNARIAHRVMIAFAVAMLANGCSTTSGVVPYGKDLFILNMADYWGVFSPSTLQIKAAEEANAYCARFGKVMQVRDFTGNGIPIFTVTSSSLIFSCILGTPPDYVPEMKQP